MKAVTKPTSKTIPPSGVNSLKFLTISKPVAANIVGMAKRKENSVAATLFIPRRRPPMMVAPERDVPGTIARDWKIPIIAAFR